MGYITGTFCILAGVTMFLVTVPQSVNLTAAIAIGLVAAGLSMILTAPPEVNPPDG